MGIRELPVRKEVFEGIDPSPKLGKIVARMKNGVEMELARRFIQAVEGVLR